MTRQVREQLCSRVVQRVHVHSGPNRTGPPNDPPGKQPKGNVVDGVDSPVQCGENNGAHHYRRENTNSVLERVLHSPTECELFDHWCRASDRQEERHLAEWLRKESVRNDVFVLWKTGQNAPRSELLMKRKRRQHQDQLHGGRERQPWDVAATRPQPEERSHPRSGSDGADDVQPDEGRGNGQQDNGGATRIEPECKYKRRQPGEYPDDGEQRSEK